LRVAFDENDVRAGLLPSTEAGRIIGAIRAEVVPRGRMVPVVEWGTE